MKRDDRIQVVVAGAARTPIGVKCGTLADFSAEDLAVLAANEAIRRSGIAPERIDAVVGANVYQFTAPGTQDIYFPRNVGIRCHLREEVPAVMVQRICGSGLQTLISGLQQILLPEDVDDSGVVLCCAAENMSRTPQIIRASRTSGNFWEFEEGGSVDDTMLTSLNHDLAQTSMMLTADAYGTRMGVTRQECDALAARSHDLARAAFRCSHFNGGQVLRGVFAVDATDAGGRPVHLARDECVRKTSVASLQALSGLTPHGLVTAGNASEISDGAAALLLADRRLADKFGCPDRYELLSYGVAGVEPGVMGRGPVPAIATALQRAGLEQKDVELWEINEAFAAQFLGVEKELGLDRETVNVNGGAIAVGHPLAATGARLVVDLIYEMERRDVRCGCASACIGGGQGVAIVVRDTSKS